jgi:hypothetical protein
MYPFQRILDFLSRYSCLIRNRFYTLQILDRSKEQCTCLSRAQCLHDCFAFESSVLRSSVYNVLNMLCNLWQCSHDMQRQGQQYLLAHV